MHNAINKLLSERYFIEGETCWDDIAKRVSIIHPESYEYIRAMKFIPSSPTLMNANTNGKSAGTLSSCFTMDIEDSIDGIFDAIKESAIVSKAAGGVGYNFSNLRSSKEMVNTIQRESGGPIPFMGVLDSTLDSVSQGGRRKGAGMAQLDCSHPDILSFIRVKDNKGVLERMNLSVRMTDEFYEKLKTSPNDVHMVEYKNGEWHELMDNGKPVTVKMLWDEIIEYAWRCAEPGIFNVSIAHRQCSIKTEQNQILSNPCSEYVLIPYSSCNLGSINLVKFVVNGKFDWAEFYKTVKVATRFLDSVIDVNNFPLEKIETVTKEIRPIGLGVMGYAHMLYKLKIPFNSKEALDLENLLLNELTITSMIESVEMAKEKGAYPRFDSDHYFKANARFFSNDSFHVQILKSNIQEFGIRNCCNTSIAPTGTISYLANVSGGIEPVFALTYARRIEKKNKEYETVFINDPIFDEYISKYADDIKYEILRKISENKGSCQNIEEIPIEMRKVFIVAGDLTPMEHLESLAVAAKNTSLSVSKTINMSSSATRDEISEVYLKAHDMGVIGVTVYRDGCREGILVHKSDDKNKEIIVKTNAPKRPKKLPTHVYRVNILNRITNESEKWIIFVGLLHNDPYEIIAGQITDIDFDHSITEGEMFRFKRDGHSVYQFLHNGEVLVENVAEAFLNEMREYITRLMSLALRHGAGIEYLKEVLQKSKGTIVDFNSAVVRAIGKYTKDLHSKEKCPTCNSELRYVEGCVKCSSPTCSFSKCS